jgi:hypothetical protein
MRAPISSSVIATHFVVVQMPVVVRKIGNQEEMVGRTHVTPTFARFRPVIIAPITVCGVATPSHLS